MVDPQRQILRCDKISRVLLSSDWLSIILCVLTERDKCGDLLRIWIRKSDWFFRPFDPVASCVGISGNNCLLYIKFPEHFLKIIIFCLSSTVRPPRRWLNWPESIWFVCMYCVSNSGWSKWRHTSVPGEISAKRLKSRHLWICVWHGICPKTAIIET